MSYDIIALSETWLNDSVYNTELFPSHYHVVRCDRKFSTVGRTRGGGVLAAFSELINADAVDTTVLTDMVPLIDIIICRCSVGNLKFLLIVIYIPPDISSHDFELFFNALETFILNDEIILVGDFNVPHFIQEGFNCPKTYTLKQFCDTGQLVQSNSILNFNGNMLDLIFSDLNIDISVKHSDPPLLHEDPHHPGLHMTLQFPLRLHTDQFPSAANSCYNWRKVDLFKLYNDLHNINWSVLKQAVDVNVAVDTFYSKLYMTMDLTVPKYRPASSKFPPWISPKIRRDIRTKDFLRRKWKETNNPEYYNEFRRLRARIKIQISNGYRSYVSRVEQNVKSDPSQLWSFLHLKQGTSRIPTQLIDNANNNFTEPQAIVNAFATTFSKVYTSDNAPSMDSTDCTRSFTINSVSEQDLIIIMSKFSTKLTAGDDLIPSFLVHDCKYAFSEPLTIIINLALRSNTFPDRWKRARISPIHKKGKSSALDNYRPIAILSNFAKVFEQVLYGRIYENVRSYISPNQHGFMSGRSTITNLAVLTQELCVTIDNCSQMDVIYTDFSHAFDTLPHNTLLYKLSNFGLSCSLLELIRSYLYNRRNYVFYNGFKSFEFVSTSGVPQGSNLGPLFFNLFINDLLQSLTCRLLAYADDLKIFSGISSNEDTELLQDNLCSIA